MLGNMFKSLFGGSGESKEKSASPVETVDHEGYTIIAEPRPAGGQWQVAGRIEKTEGDETRVHTFIRADTLPDQDSAANEMIRKAKMMIDQQGDTIFD